MLSDKIHFTQGYVTLWLMMRTYEFEYWSSLDSKYIILEIEAESEVDAVKQFKKMHPHKKYRLLDPLDE